MINEIESKAEFEASLHFNKEYDYDRWWACRCCYIAGTKALSAIGEGEWLTEKPEFNEECLLMTATWIEDKYKLNSHWYYTLFEIRKEFSDEGDDNDGGFCYMGIFQDDDEWGDLADLSADLYKVIKPLNTRQI